MREKTAQKREGKERDSFAGFRAKHCRIAAGFGSFCVAQTIRTPAMTQGRRPERALCVRVLNRVARKCGLQPVADNAARAKMESLAADVLARDLLPADVEAVNNSMQKYQATFEAAVPNPEGPPQPVASPTTYKFQAVQLTYNSSAAAFVSQDLVELEALFERFKVFLASLRASLSVIGVSATMERASPERVHLHAYLHLSKPFIPPSWG